MRTFNWNDVLETTLILVLMVGILACLVALVGLISGHTFLRTLATFSVAGVLTGLLYGIGLYCKRSNLPYINLKALVAACVMLAAVFWIGLGGVGLFFSAFPIIYLCLGYMTDTVKTDSSLQA